MNRIIAAAAAFALAAAAFAQTESLDARAAESIAIAEGAAYFDRFIGPNGGADFLADFAAEVGASELSDADKFASLAGLIEAMRPKPKAAASGARAAAPLAQWDREGFARWRADGNAAIADRVIAKRIDAAAERLERQEEALRSARAELEKAKGELSRGGAESKPSSGEAPPSNRAAKDNR